MDAPLTYVAARFVHTYTRWSILDDEVAAQNGLTSPSTAIWPVAATALYFPVRIPWPFNVRRYLIYNGTTANDNFDIGIYSRNYQKINSVTGAQTGTSVLQYSSAVDFVLSPGMYYLALVLQNATGHTFQRASGLQFTRSGGCLKETSAYPLPSTMTPVTVTSSYVPFFGMTSTTSGF